MSKLTNEKLVAWIEQKVKSEYPNDISLVLIYGSYINGTANAKSDIDCYFIPKTKRGYQMATTFIIDDIGYDIFPMDWNRVENIANLKEVLLPLVGDVKILYSASENDLARFHQLQAKMRENLASVQVTRTIAQEKIESAYELYQEMSRSNCLSEIRKLAGLLIMYLADAVMIYNQDYFHFGLKTQFQDLRKLQETRNVPDKICEEYLQTIQAKTAEESIGHCHSMLCAVKDYMSIELAPDLKKPEEAVGGVSTTSCTDFASLAS